MDVAQIAKYTQQQAVAAWVDYLNQLRLNELLAKLAAQDINLEQALAELQKMKTAIASVIETGKMRGGTKGAHGFIAEIAEVYIRNARNLIKGLDSVYKWVNNKGLQIFSGIVLKSSKNSYKLEAISVWRQLKLIFRNTLIFFRRVENIRFLKTSMMNSKEFCRFLKKRRQRNLPKHIGCGNGYKLFLKIILRFLWMI